MNKSFFATTITTFGCSGVKPEDFPESIKKEYYSEIFRLLKAQNHDVCSISLHKLHLACKDQLKYGKCDFASTMRDLFRSIPDDYPDLEQINLSLDYIFPFEKSIDN